LCDALVTTGSRRQSPLRIASRKIDRHRHATSVTVRMRRSTSNKTQGPKGRRSWGGVFSRDKEPLPTSKTLMSPASSQSQREPGLSRLPNGFLTFLYLERHLYCYFVFDRRLLMFLSVRDRVCPLAYLKNHVSKFHECFCT